MTCSTAFRLIAVAVNLVLRKWPIPGLQLHLGGLSLWRATGIRYADTRIIMHLICILYRIHIQRLFARSSYAINRSDTVIVLVL